MNFITNARKKLSGVNTKNEIQPTPSVAVTTVVDNPRFEQANIDTSTAVPTIDGTFAIDITNSGLLPTRATRVTNAKIELIKDQSSLIIGTIEEPQSIGSISGGTTETLKINFEREGDFLNNVTQEVCKDGKVKTNITVTISEVLLAATYRNELEIPVNRSDCKTITINITGQSDINIDEQYRWKINQIGDGNIGRVSWDMGDGASYTGRSVTHSYSETGGYTISVDTEEGYSASLDVNVSIIPFGLVGPVDLTVGDEGTWNATGDNLSQIDNITWNFGDGTTKSKRSNSVSHIYRNPGEFEINAVSNTGFDDSLTVNATYPDATVESIEVPQQLDTGIQFNPIVRGNNLDDVDEVRWSMGDGTTLTGEEVTHTYSDSREYNITVDLIINDVSISSESVTVTSTYDYISIASISAPSTVNNQEDFNAAVRGNNLADADELRWDMGDGVILNGREITHRYATSGEYEVLVEAIVNGESIASESTVITAEQFVL